MEQEIIQKLKLSGLTQREAHIYLALLQKKEFAASEIASMIPVGRTKIYEIIPRLVKMGFCTEVQKDGKKMYSAVEPKVALHSIFTEYQNELDNLYEKKEKLLLEKKSLINELKSDLSKVYSNNNSKTDEIDYVEVLKDRNKIKSRWIELQKNIKYELLGFNKPPYVVKFEQNYKEQERLLKKKIKGRGIYEYSSSTKQSDEEFFKIIEGYSGIGEECRVIDKLPMKMMVIDEKIAVLALNDPVSMQSTITTMIIEHHGFAMAQKEVFESYWSRAVPLQKFKKGLKN